MSCEKHSRRVEKYQGTLEDLANDIGDLHYDSLMEFFGQLAIKLMNDSSNDYKGGRKKLSNSLEETARQLIITQAKFQSAWNISKRYMKQQNLGRDILLGVAVGDALGVPVEFQTREQLLKNPVTDMTGYGTHNQPAGTWSDDTSLTLCLAESLAEGLDIDTLGDKFVKWRDEAYWTAHNQTFDIGIATNKAISRIELGTNPLEAGGILEGDNGNGSLMRILPLLLVTRNLSAEERFGIIRDISSITHGHIISVMCCFYYLEYALCLIKGFNKIDAYNQTNKIVWDKLYKFELMSHTDVAKLNVLVSGMLDGRHREDIASSGYVLSSLEASIWCLLETDNYKDAILKAVNLGGDTDTIAAITGGLASLYYGHETIPEDWVNKLARKDDIIALADKLDKVQ